MKSPNAGGLTCSLINLKDREFLENQRIAGKVASGAIQLLKQLVSDKTQLTMLELNKLAEEFIRDNNCESTFKGYKGFPNGVCISVNEMLVHGICDSYILKIGDLISFDLGATYKGAIADTATTMIFDEPKSKDHIKLIEITKECLSKSISLIDNTMKSNQTIRIGAIGDCIYRHAKNNGYSVFNQYGGHGIDFNEPHAHPFVSNRDSKENGIRIVSGMTIAIEPLLISNTHSIETHVSNDKWSILAKGICAHEEHTIFIHSDHVEIITQ